jgi:catechol 2,3-dioxygenase-like lactoylglutathione lyase family enzyme
LTCSRTALRAAAEVQHYRSQEDRVKIEHVAIWSKDLEALRQFYETYFEAKANKKYINHSKEFEHRVTGMATVFPGENNAEHILQTAFDSGLGGLKLHAHVQCFDMNADYMNCLYE